MKANELLWLGPVLVALRVWGLKVVDKQAKQTLILFG